MLRVDRLSVALPPGSERALAVDDVSFDLAAGETLCLVGGSGSGKSVLAAAVMGALPPRLARIGGGVMLGDRDLTALSERDLGTVRGNRIALIPQEPTAALNPVQRIGDQLGEVFELHRPLPRAARDAAVATLLADVGLPGLARRFPHQLSGGQCQRVMIAMALALCPDVLLADEPTTALDTTTQAGILALIAARRQATGVLFVTHDFGIVRDIADRIGVMHAGRLVELGAAADVLEHPRHPYTRALLAAVPQLMARPPRAATEPVLTVRGLAKRFGSVAALAGADLVLTRGATLAVVGGSGSGKSTLARLVAGIGRADTGTVEVAAAGRHRVQMIFQDPVGALNPRRRVGPVVARAAELAGLPRAAASTRARELLALVGLGDDAYDRTPAAFSGGQRQRIGIARALASDPAVLIADESVSALDVLVAAEVLGVLADLQARLGLALLFITHDLRAAAAVADRIAVMDAGCIVETGPMATVLVHPAHPVTRALIAAIPGRSAEERASTSGP